MAIAEPIKVLIVDDSRLFRSALEEALAGQDDIRLVGSVFNGAKAIEFIRKTGLSGRMLNDYVFGGYLIWALPEHKVFVDGRTDIYDWTGVLADYGAWAMLRTDPRTLLDKYHIGFCHLSRTAPMSRVLPSLPGWKMVYSDERSIIFARNAEI